jgi:hypothetical protein
MKGGMMSKMHLIRVITISSSPLTFNNCLCCLKRSNRINLFQSFRRFKTRIRLSPLVTMFLLNWSLDKWRILYQRKSWIDSWNITHFVLRYKWKSFEKHIISFFNLRIIYSLRWVNRRQRDIRSGWNLKPIIRNRRNWSL